MADTESPFTDSGKVATVLDIDRQDLALQSGPQFAPLAVILGTILIPSTALMLALFLAMHMVGLFSTPWAIIPPGLVNPFGVYLMRIVWGQGFENDLIEASRLDGASETRIFFRIGLPLVATGLTTLGLLSFVGAWNSFFWSLIVVSDERLYPLTLGLAIWNSAGTVTGCNPFTLSSHVVR